MDNDRLITAIGRIERALSQIEQFDVNWAKDAENLQNRHDALKSELSQTIKTIDDLIARKS